MEKISTIKRKKQAIDEFEIILKTYILPLLQYNGECILREDLMVEGAKLQQRNLFAMWIYYIK